MNVIKLIDKTGSAKSWGPQDVCDELQQGINNKEIGSKVIVIHLDTTNESYNTQFIQCGMSMSEVIALLEVAKMDVYKKHMADA